MPRRSVDSYQSPDISTLAGRVVWILIHVFGGNMRRMAAAIGVTHAVLSQVVNGHQGPGKHLIRSIVLHTNINPDWISTGEGERFLALQPVKPIGGYRLPVARCLLPGLPDEHPSLMTEEMVDVAESRYRASAYWYRLGADDPIILSDSERVLPGDLLLLNADAAVWQSNLSVLADALVVQRRKVRRRWCYSLARTTLDAASGLPTFRTFGPDPDGGVSPNTEQTESTMRLRYGKPGRAIELDDPDDGVKEKLPAVQPPQSHRTHPTQHPLKTKRNADGQNPELSLDSDQPKISSVVALVVDLRRPYFDLSSKTPVERSPTATPDRLQIERP